MKHIASKGARMKTITRARIYLSMAVMILTAPLAMPALKLSCGGKIRLALPAAWLDAHPQTAFLLDQEGAVWEQFGVDWKLTTS